MKKSLIFILKMAIYLLAVVVIAGMIRFPRTEGRAANLDLLSIYLNPFIIYIYVGSIPFFVGLYHAIKLLSLIDANKTLSLNSVNSLKKIKYASVILIAFVIFALIYIRFFAHGEDSAGPTALGMLVSLLIAIVATIAHFFQKNIQNHLHFNSKRG